MDTSPFANNNPQQQQPPEYLKQANNPSMAGAASNMVKALLSGNQQFQAKQNAMGGGGAMGPAGDGQWQGTMSVGGAPLAGYSGVTPQMSAPQMPPPQAAGMQGGVPTGAGPMGGGQAPSPFMAGAPPVTVDPITQALMSPIPGM